MFSRLHRWPVWLLALLIGGWLSAAAASAVQEATDAASLPGAEGSAEEGGEKSSAAGLDKSAAEPANGDAGEPSVLQAPGLTAPDALEKGSADDGKSGPGAPVSPSPPIFPALNASFQLPGLIQRRLERSDGVTSFPSAPGAEAVDSSRIAIQDEESPPLPVAPAVAVGPAEPLEPPPIHHLTVMLDWYPSPRHAALLVAQQRELFSQRGLQVEIVTPADPEVPTKLLAAGRIDLALTRQPLLHLLVDEGKPLIRVATLTRLPLSFLLVNGAAEPDSLPPLEGARIGHLDQDGEQVLLAALLAKQKLSREQVDSPKVHFRIADAMREGRIDAIIGAMQHQLPEILANEGLTTHVYRVEEFGVPLHDGLIVIANRNRLKDKRDAIRHFVDALEEASAWIFNNPEASWSLLVDAEPGMDTPINRRAWPEVRARLSLSPAALSQGRYIDFEQYLFDAGIVDSLTPVSRLALDSGAPRPR